MSIYHVTNGKAFRAPDGMTLPQYRETIRKAYGTLLGVRFVTAENRNTALHKATRNQ